VKNFLCLTIVAGACCAALSGCGGEIRVDNKGWGIRAINEMAKVENGLLEVQVDVKNISIMTVKFEYCFMWSDRAGFVLPGVETVWKSDSLKSGETKSLRETAPSRKARKAGLAIRQAESFGSIED
jgi:hypothetical protein